MDLKRERVLMNEVGKAQKQRLHELGKLHKIEVNELGIRNRHDYCGKEHHAENCFQTQNIQRTYAAERKVQQPVRTAHTRSEASWKVDDR